MVADIVMALGLALFVIVMGLAFGVWFETGVLGLAVFLLLSIAWSLAFTGFPYTVALRTGNPAAVNSRVPDLLSVRVPDAGLPAPGADVGLDARCCSLEPRSPTCSRAMRTILTTGWDGAALAKGAAAILGLAVVTFFMAFRSLARRVATG